MINTSNKETLISIAFFSFVLFFVFSGFAISKTECEGPSKLVKITVKEVTISPPTYVYEIINLYQSSIINFTLGASDHKEMRIMPDNIPKAVESPQGWGGESVFVEETEFMHIFWSVKDNQFEIAPGTSLTGFKLIMPQPVERKKPLYHPSGAPAVPHNMKKTPFKVRFKDGTCVWGKVQAE